MNYFPFHIGDYASHTAHLTWDEDMAYTRLLRAYYQTERPIPQGQAYRFARATTPAQKKAVDQVLSEFFVVEDAGHTQKRCDKEIALFQQKQAKEPSKKQNERERQIRARERRKAMFEELRIMGVVAPWDTTTEQLQAVLSQHQTRQENIPITQPVTRDNTATQEPITNNQEPITKIKTEDTGIPTSPAVSVCVVVKKLGIGGVNPQHAGLQELIEQGATVQDFADAAPICLKAGKGFAYLVGIVRSARQDTARLAQFATAKQAEPSWRTEQRNRTLQAVPSIAERSAFTKNFIDTEAVNVPAIAMG